MNISKKEKIHVLISSALKISATLCYAVFNFRELDLDPIESVFDGFSAVLLIYLILFAVILGIKSLFIKKNSI